MRRSAPGGRPPHRAARRGRPEGRRLRPGRGRAGRQGARAPRHHAGGHAGDGSGPRVAVARRTLVPRRSAPRRSGVRPRLPGHLDGPVPGRPRGAEPHRRRHRVVPAPRDPPAGGCRSAGGRARSDVFRRRLPAPRRVVGRGVGVLRARRRPRRGGPLRRRRRTGLRGRGSAGRTRRARASRRWTGPGRRSARVRSGRRWRILRSTTSSWRRAGTRSTSSRAGPIGRRRSRPRSTARSVAARGSRRCA